MEEKVVEEIINYFQDGIKICSEFSASLKPYGRIEEYCETIGELKSGNLELAIDFLERELETIHCLKDKFGNIPVTDPKNANEEVMIIKMIENGDMNEDEIQIFSWIKDLRFYHDRRK